MVPGQRTNSVRRPGGGPDGIHGRGYEPPRATGGLLVAGALASGTAAMVLASTFQWPGIPPEPADVVLPSSVAIGTSLGWTWFATAWTYAIRVVPILLLPTVLGRRSDPVRRAATDAGATSVVLSPTGFLRRVVVVPPLAESSVAGDAATRAAVDAAAPGARSRLHVHRPTPTSRRPK